MHPADKATVVLVSLMFGILVYQMAKSLRRPPSGTRQCASCGQPTTLHIRYSKGKIRLLFAKWKPICIACYNRHMENAHIISVEKRR